MFYSSDLVDTMIVHVWQIKSITHFYRKYISSSASTNDILMRWQRFATLFYTLASHLINCMAINFEFVLFDDTGGHFTKQFRRTFPV